MADIAFLKRKLQQAQGWFVVLNNTDGVKQEDLDDAAADITYWQDLINRAEGKPGVNINEALKEKP